MTTVVAPPNAIGSPLSTSRAIRWPLRDATKHGGNSWWTCRPWFRSSLGPLETRGSITASSAADHPPRFVVSAHLRQQMPQHPRDAASHGTNTRLPRRFR
jgi:hypothetical protein